MHDRVAFEPQPVGDELALGRLVVDQQQVGVAVRGDAYGLAGSDRDDLDLDAARLRELRQQPFEQPGVLRGSRRCNRDRARFALCRARNRQDACHQSYCHTPQSYSRKSYLAAHVVSPYVAAKKLLIIT